MTRVCVCASVCVCVCMYAQVYARALTHTHTYTRSKTNSLASRNFYSFSYKFVIVTQQTHCPQHYNNKIVQPISSTNKRSVDYSPLSYLSLFAFFFNCNKSISRARTHQNDSHLYIHPVCFLANFQASQKKWFEKKKKKQSNTLDSQNPQIYFCFSRRRKNCCFQSVQIREKAA